MRPIKPIAMHEITGLGRPLDLTMTSNRVAVVGSSIAGALGVLFSWLSVGELGLLSAASVAIGVFLAWALVREIDPDNGSAPYLAMVIAGILGLISAPAALVVAVLLLTTRVLTGTVGTSLRPFDLVVLVALAGYAGTQPVAWPIVGLLAYAILRSRNVRARITAAAVVAVAVTTALLFVPDLAPAMPGLGTWAVLIVLTAFGWRSIRSGRVESKADSGAPISSVGVSVARLSLLTAIGTGAVMAPESALSDLSPAVAAFAAMALWPRRVVAPAETLDEPVPVAAPTIPIAF